MTKVLRQFHVGGDKPNGRDALKADRACARNTSRCQTHANSKFRRFVRAYIIDQLRKNNFEALADIHANHEECCDDGSELMLHHLAGNLAEERKRQFEDILNRLQLDDENLAETYQTIVKEVFIDGINWGRILAFLVFAGSLAVYCAREGMEERISDIISWTENDVEKTISRWMETQGGWSAFVDHFDNSWTIEVPPYILAGVFTAVVAGGLFLLKKLF